MTVKARFSYERTEDLKKVLEQLGPMVRTYKVARKQQGRYKKAYVCLDVEERGR